MADYIDFLSGSCKQDVTDLICLSAHLNLNRKLEVAEKERLREATGALLSEQLACRWMENGVHKRVHQPWGLIINTFYVYNGFFFKDLLEQF